MYIVWNSHLCTDIGLQISIRHDNHFYYLYFSGFLVGWRE